VIIGGTWRFGLIQDLAFHILHEIYFVVIHVFQGSLILDDLLKSGILTYLALAECINEILLDKDVAWGWLGSQVF
jgi:hypothetical protein